LDYHYNRTFSVNPINLIERGKFVDPGTPIAPSGTYPPHAPTSITNPALPHHNPELYHQSYHYQSYGYNPIPKHAKLSSAITHSVMQQNITNVPPPYGAYTQHLLPQIPSQYSSIHGQPSPPQPLPQTTRHYRFTHHNPRDIEAKQSKSPSRGKNVNTSRQLETYPHEKEKKDPKK